MVDVRREEFRTFVARHVAPCAAQWDRDQRIPESVLAQLGDTGYLGGMLPPDYGGQGWNAATFGVLNEVFGQASSSLTGVITVQAMVSMALLKWGTEEQKRTWLPQIAQGRTIGSFALTEPGAGSSLKSLTTELTPSGDALVLNGVKRWISCAQFAGVFLVFGNVNGNGQRQPAACLVPRDTPGVRVEPITDLVAFRAAGLAQVHFDNVAVPKASLVGKPGFALSHVAPFGLQYGRISTACSSLGLLRGCFEESIAYAATRQIGDKALGDLGMMRSLIARMGTDLEAATALCYGACQAEDEHRPDAFERTLMAKYFSSRAAVQAASDAVQIRGASGVHESSIVSRYYRDAKAMEILEGTTQVHEDLLGKIFVGQARRVHD